MIVFSQLDEYWVSYSVFHQPGCARSDENFLLHRRPRHDLSIRWSAMIRIGLPWSVQSHLGNTAQVTAWVDSFSHEIFSIYTLKGTSPLTRKSFYHLVWLKRFAWNMQNLEKMLRNNCHGSLFFTGRYLVGVKMEDVWKHHLGCS